MMVVRIEKPENTMLAVWFAELRSWLDENHCEPTIFSESGKKIDKLLFNVTFSDNTHARSFASAFKKYATSIRGTTKIERDSLNSNFAVEIPTSEGR
jgi:hypothetical protein